MKNRSGSGRQLIIIGLVGTLLAACGGGGGSGGGDAPPLDTQAPAAKINFPTEQALTTADSITVTGTATDAQKNAIASVTVNNEPATSENDFANWRAVIPLTAGRNEIVVETADDQGNSDASAASIEIKNEVALLNPSDVEIDPTGNRALLVDSALRAIVAVDLTSGLRSILSDDAIGTGSPFSAPSSIAVDSDRALVADGSKIITVDLTNGNRSELATVADTAIVQDIAVDKNNSDRLLIATFLPETATTSRIYKLQTAPSTGGPATDFSPAVTFTTDSSIVVDNNRVLVASTDGTVIEVDLSTGVPNTIASATVGTGVALVAPFDISLSADGSKALIADAGTPAIIAIDLSTLERSVASGANTGTGGDILLPEAIATDIDSNRSIVVDPILNALVTVEENGDRGILTSADVANGPAFIGPINIAYDATNDRMLVTDLDTSVVNATDVNATAIISVDLDNGDRSILSDAGVGSGPEFESLVNLTVGDNQVFVTDIDATSIFSVDLTTGNRTPLVTSFGNSRSPLGIGLDSTNNTLYVSVIVANAAAAPVSSELFSLATNGTTATQFPLSGTSLRFAQNIAVDSEAGTAYVVDSKISTTDSVADQIIDVTLAGGAASSLGSIEGNVTPQENELPTQDIAIMGNEIVVVDSFQGAMFAINRDTNARRDISSDATGNGVALQGPTGVSYVNGRNILLVSDRSSFAIFAVEPGSGDRVIISR